MSEHEEAISNFSELTQVPAEVAKALLERNKWNVEAALDDFYNGPTQRPRSETPIERPTPSTGGSSSSSINKPKPKPTFKSFSQLVNDQNDNEDDDEQLYAGGGRGSGLNVENPNSAHNLVQDLLKKAEAGGSQSRDGSSSEPRTSFFNGVGHTLGDSNTPSRAVGAAQTRGPKRLEKANRRITFWKDGFQVGDGELYRYDDPANSSYLAELNAGRAPLSLLDVQYGQEVDVEVAKKLDEEYKPPKRKIGGFQGVGQRLGSPVSPDYQQPITQVTETTQQEKPKEEEIKEQGDASVQIRFADGRRVVHKFDSSASVETVYQFVKSQTADSRPFTINYSFPVKPIEDLKQTIKEAGIINSVILQRWVQ